MRATLFAMFEWETAVPRLERRRRSTSVTSALGLDLFIGRFRPVYFLASACLTDAQIEVDDLVQQGFLRFCRLSASSARVTFGNSAIHQCLLHCGRVRRAAAGYW